MLRRKAGYAFSHLDPNLVREFALVSHVKTNAQFLGFFIQQQDRKDLIIKYFTHQFSNPAQGRVQVERGVDHIGHLEQKWLDLGLKIGLDGG